MPPLTDPDRLAAYRDALGNWSVTDYIQFELTEQAHRWIRLELGNVTLKDIGRLMFEHVNAGGEIDEVPETRPEWSEVYEFHHDLRLTIHDKPVYVETRLHYRLPVVVDESWILVVNVNYMNANRSKESKRPVGAERPFPWRCRHCGKNEVVMITTCYDAEIRHDGRLYTFTIPHLDIPVCQACGEKVLTEKVDDQLNAALRSHLHLLTPEEMRTALERVSMTQKQAADRLGIAEATLSRWLNETQIQSRAMDNLLRVFFAFPQVRTALNGDAQDPELGAADITGQRQGHHSD